MEPTVNWTTWLYIDCCCDTCCRSVILGCDRPRLVTNLIHEDGLSELFNKCDDFLRISRLVQDPRNLSLVR